LSAIKILIADDHTLVREGLSKVIDLDPVLTVIGQAADGQQAVQKAKELNPDIVLMDLNMPVMDGLAAAALIKRDCPATRIITLTIEDREDKVIDVFRSGVDGYILKDIEAEALLWTIKAVHAGATVIHPNIADVLYRRLGDASNQVACSAESSHILSDLTPRELQVLELIARGIHNGEIARMLFISEKTVKNHISSIFKKLQVEDRTQAALTAIKLKLISQ